MTWLDAVARTRLTHWRGQGLERRPAVFSGAQDPVAVIEGKQKLLFSSSNYLGLSTHPAVIAAAGEALEHYGVGSGGSRLTTGTTRMHREAEHLFKTVCLLYGSGTSDVCGHHRRDQSVGQREQPGARPACERRPFGFSVGNERVDESDSADSCRQRGRRNAAFI